MTVDELTKIIWQILSEAAGLAAGSAVKEVMGAAGFLRDEGSDNADDEDDEDDEGEGGSTQKRKRTKMPEKRLIICVPAHQRTKKQEEAHSVAVVCLL